MQAIAIELLRLSDDQHGFSIWKNPIWRTITKDDSPPCYPPEQTGDLAAGSAAATEIAHSALEFWRSHGSDANFQSDSGLRQWTNWVETRWSSWVIQEVIDETLKEAGLGPECLTRNLRIKTVRDNDLPKHVTS